MRKLFTVIFSILLAGSIVLSNGPVTYADDIQPGNNVNVNGQRLIFDVPTISMNGRTLVPLRGVFEELGADVEWIQDEHRVIITYHDTIINLQQYNKEATVNGIVKQMDVAPIAYNGRTMIPLRFISENLGMSVQWIQGARLATITEPSYFDNLPETAVLGYTTNDYKGDSQSYDSVTKYSDEMNYIATFSYQIDENGNLKQTGESQDATVKYANANNIKSLVLIHNFRGSSFDKLLAQTVLSDKEKRQNLINSILVVMGKGEYSGVNIDLENISSEDKNNYSTFIKELKETLTLYGFITTVSIPAKTSDNGTYNSWSAGFDYKEIGKYADKVMIMTYDEHYFGGNAGPIASLSWVEDVLDYATANISSKKILLGIAGYGYDWSDSGDSVVTYKNVDNLASSVNVQSFWDNTSKSPFLIYNKDGTSHQVWYENSRSISYKLDLVSRYKLGGIGIWRLGFDNDDFWDTINNKINIG